MNPDTEKLKDIKPSWYFQVQKYGHYFRFYVGKCEGKLGGKKHWVFNIGLYFVDFGYAY